MAATVGVKLSQVGQFEVVGVSTDVGTAEPAGGTNGLVVDHLLHSEAVAFKRHWLGVVQKPVEDGRGQGSEIEDFRPVLVDAIRRDRD